MHREDLDKAKKIFGLSDSVTITRLKRLYRCLIKNVHSDIQEKSTEDSEKIARDLNWAYKILLEFCENSEIPLDSGKLPLKNYEEWWKEQYGSSGWDR